MTNKRTKADTVMGINEQVTINGVIYSPKRFKLFEALAIQKEKAEKVKKIHALQRRAIALQSRAETFGNVSAEDTSVEGVLEVVQEAHTIQEQFLSMSDDADPYWILPLAYPDAQASGDLDLIDFEEADAALEAVFEMNPSLKKVKAQLLMNPLNQNG